MVLSMQLFNRSIFYCENQSRTTILWIRFPLFHQHITSGLKAYLSKIRQCRKGLRQNIFKDIVDLELFNSASTVLLDFLPSCFLGLLQNKFKESVEESNEQIIRVSMDDRLVDLIKCISSHIPDSQDY